MPEVQERAPRKRKRATTLTAMPRPETHRQPPNFKSFDHPTATFMFLRPSSDFVLWNSTSAMRRNGFRPSEVAEYLSSQYGIEIYDPRRKEPEKPYPFEALAFFEKLVIRDGVKAPSLVYDEPWGNA
jgi:hypothetical protein